MKHKILNVLAILFGLLMINGGLDKFLHYMPMPADLPAEMVKDATAMMEVAWLMPLVAVGELLGGILLLFRKTRALGAVVLFPIMLGILLMNIFVAPSGIPIVLALWAILLWIMYENRARYTPMIGK